MPQETDGGVFDDSSEPGVDASYPIEMDFGTSNYPAAPLTTSGGEGPDVLDLTAPDPDTT